MSKRGGRSNAVLTSAAIRGAARGAAKKKGVRASAENHAADGSPGSPMQGHVEAWLEAERADDDAEAAGAEQSSAVVIALFKRAPTKKGHQKTVFARRSVEASDVTPLGLAESSEYHVEHPEQVRDQRERGILVQCVSSYATLEDRYPGVQDTQESGGFGENMVVDGLDVDTVCIGDRFEVIQNDGTPRSVAFVVTSPRRPCGSVDFTHGKMHRKGGVRDACASGGLGGFFFRAVRQDEDAPQDADYSVVLGEIAVGDRLIRAVHNYPQWSVQRVSSALYAGWSEGVPYKLWYDTDQWANVEVPLSNDELAELVSIEDLAEEEWRDQIRIIQKFRAEQGWSFDAVGGAIRKAFGW